MYWWVNHRLDELEDERRCGMLFAPLVDRRGRTPDHWARLRAVRTGDRLLAFASEGLHAILTAKSDAAPTDYPEGFVGDARVGGRPPGWGVSVDWRTMPATIPLAELLSGVSVISLQGVGQPLDRNGLRKQGYVFALSTEVGAQLIRKAAS